MTLGVSFTFFAVRINATTEVTEDSIPCTTPPNLRCQSQLGGGLIHGEGNRIDSIPLPDWLAKPRDKINGESIKVLSLHGLAVAVGHMPLLFLDRTTPIKAREVLNL